MCRDEVEYSQRVEQGGEGIYPQKLAIRLADPSRSQAPDPGAGKGWAQWGPNPQSRILGTSGLSTQKHPHSFPLPPSSPPHHPYAEPPPCPGWAPILRS